MRKEPRTVAARQLHEDWHAGEVAPMTPKQCGTLGCVFLGWLLSIEDEACDFPGWLLSEAGEDMLALLYGDHDQTPAYVAVARACDEVIDRSGALLGRVRSKAEYRYHPTRPGGLTQEQLDAGDFV